MSRRPQHPAPAAAAPPTAEQIAMAWRHLRNRAGCPDTLDAALAHPVYGRCVHGLAVNLSRRAAPTGQLGAAASAAANLGPCRHVPPEPSMPLPQTRSSTLRLAPRRGTRGIDLKRAAANDTED